MTAKILDELSIGEVGVTVTTCPSEPDIRVIYISAEHLERLDKASKSTAQADGTFRIGNGQFAAASMCELVKESFSNLKSNGGSGHRKNSTIMWQCRHCCPNLSNESEWFPCSGRHWKQAGLSYKSPCFPGIEFETTKRHLAVCAIKHSLEALTNAVKVEHPEYSAEAITALVTTEHKKWQRRCRKQDLRGLKRKAIEGEQARLSSFELIIILQGLNRRCVLMLKRNRNWSQNQNKRRNHQSWNWRLFQKVHAQRRLCRDAERIDLVQDNLTYHFCVCRCAI